MRSALVTSTLFTALALPAGALAQLPAPAPVLTAIAPASGTTGFAGGPVMIDGTGFVDGDVVLADGAPLVTSFVSATRLTATLPASLFAEAGSRVIQVVTAPPDAALSNALVFTVNNAAPVLVSIAPASATAGGASFSLALNGLSFAPGASVSWNGAALELSFWSTTRLTATVPAGLILSSGTAQVTVVNPAPGGGTSAARVFTVNAALVPPSVTLLTPQVVGVGSPGGTFALDGSGFAPGARVRANGADLTTTFVSSTRLAAALPASLLQVITTLAIDVVNPDGGTSTSRPLAVGNPLPSIGSVAPPSVPAGSASLVLSVFGDGFTPSSRVLLDATPMVTTYVSRNLVRGVLVPEGLVNARTAQVTVDNPAPGGGTSAARSFTIVAGPPPAPVLSAILPASGPEGFPGGNLGLLGSAFTANSRAYVGDLELATTFTSQAQLVAYAPASLFAAAGTFDVTIVTPPPGGGTSAPLTFTVLRPCLEIDDTCDGVDDDCDGSLDEDSLPVETSCGAPGCETTGLEICLFGERVDTCEPPRPSACPGPGFLTSLFPEGTMRELVVLGDGSMYAGGDGNSGHPVLTRLDAAGAPLWLRDWGTNASFGGLAAGPGDHVFVAGGSWEPDPDAADVVLLELDADGSIVRELSWGEPGRYESAEDVAVDPAGNVAVAGSAYDPGSGDSFIFLALFDGAGAPLWAHRFSVASGSFHSSPRVAFDPLGFVVLAGGTDDEDGYTDAFLVRLDLSGAPTWSITYAEPEGTPNETSSNAEYVTGVAVDLDGDILLTGSSGSLGEGWEGEATFVTRFDGATGAIEWQRWWGSGMSYDYTNGLSLDASGHIFATGESQGLYLIGPSDLFLLELSPAGDLVLDRVWGRSWNGAVGHSVGTAPDGSILVLGTDYGDRFSNQGLWLDTELELNDLGLEATPSTLAMTALAGTVSALAAGVVEIEAVDSPGPVLVRYGDLPPVITSLNIWTDDPPNLLAGGTAQLYVEGYYWDGTPVDLTSEVEWSSSQPSAGSIDELGVFTAADVGETLFTSISATIDGINPDGASGPMLMVAAPWTGSITTWQAEGCWAPRDVAFDALGGAFVTGPCWELGGTYVIRYDAARELVWQKLIPEARDPERIRVDTATGELVLIAHGTARGSVILTKLDAEGQLLWQRSSAVGCDQASVAIDASGDLVTAGGAFGVGAGAGSACVARYSGATGELIWARTLGATVFNPGMGYDTAVDVATDAFGHAYVLGFSNDTPSSYDYWLAELDASGALVGTWNINQASDDGRVALDPAGNLYVGYSLNGSYANASQLVRIDRNGGPSWRAPISVAIGGAAAFTSATGLHLDALGNIYLTGQGNAPNGGPSGTFLYLYAFDPDGAPFQHRVFGMIGGAAQGFGVHVDAAGDLVVGGFVGGLVEESGWAATTPPAALPAFFPGYGLSAVPLAGTSGATFTAPTTDLEGSDAYAGGDAAMLLVTAP